VSRSPERSEGDVAISCPSIFHSPLFDFLFLNFDLLVTNSSQNSCSLSQVSLASLNRPPFFVDSEGAGDKIVIGWRYGRYAA